MSYKSIGIDKSASFKRTSAFPLDELNYFEDYDSMITAAKTAQDAGSTDTAYFFGQQLTYVNNGSVSTYVITKGSDGKGQLDQIQLSTNIFNKVDRFADETDLNLDNYTLGDYLNMLAKQLSGGTTQNENEN